MGKTSIEWTDASWNPIVGCTEISPGCANCYAARLAGTRLKATSAYKGLAGRGVLKSGAWWTGEVRFIPERLKEPLHWKEPLRIFVCDMGDLFHESVKDDWIEEVFFTIVKCPQHIFQILTKRAERMRAYARSWSVALPNVWLGVSVENQHFADERVPLLLGTPAAVRWISAEPLLGPIDIAKYLPHGWRYEGLNWVVCGGESGPNARPMHPDWARSLRDQCQAAGVPFFFKQWGECVTIGSEVGTIGWLYEKVGKKKAGRLLDGREWNEFPQSPTT